jgi:hypothetical protein
MMNWIWLDASLLCPSTPVTMPPLMFADMLPDGAAGIMPNVYTEADDDAKLVTEPLSTCMSPAVKPVTPSEKVTVTGIGFFAVCCPDTLEVSVTVRGGSGSAANTVNGAPSATRPNIAAAAADFLANTDNADEFMIVSINPFNR